MNINSRLYPSATVVASLLCLFGLSGCGPGGRWGVSKQTEVVVAGNNTFALHLYRQLKGTNGNLFFSPYSISECLALASAGARGNTVKQMARVLHFGTNSVQAAFAELREVLAHSQKRGGVEVSVANGIWTQANHPMLPAFLSVSRQYHDAVVKEADFRMQPDAVAKDIDDWVSTKTKGRIGGIIPQGSIDPEARLVLVNAIYFKGVWKTKFNPKSTHDREFWVSPDRAIRCPMMVCSGRFRNGYHSGLPVSCQIIELPYVGKDCSLIALLPLDRDGLADLERELNQENLEIWLASLQETEIGVLFPKLKLQTRFSLDETLSAMGVSDAFSDSADFSGIDGTKMLYISSILHQAIVEINESGTVAAAATVTRVSAKSKPASFVADHPFLFLIRENRSGSILFLGRVADPSK